MTGKCASWLFQPVLTQILAAGRAKLGWVGLGWVGLGTAGLGWAGLVLPGSSWAVSRLLMAHPAPLATPTSPWLSPAPLGPPCTHPWLWANAGPLLCVLRNLIPPDPSDRALVEPPGARPPRPGLLVSHSCAQHSCWLSARLLLSGCQISFTSLLSGSWVSALHQGHRGNPGWLISRCWPTPGLLLVVHHRAVLPIAHAR